jgi:hypothetical protein
MSQYFIGFFKACCGLAIVAAVCAPLNAAAEPVAEQSYQNNGYLGIGGAIGLNGNTTSLSTGGVVVLSKVRLSNNFSLHDATVLFGSAAATSMIIVTADLPIRNSTGQTVVSPFIGGGAMLRYDQGLSISPAISGGIDIPLARGFTGTVRVNAGFPSNRNADVGVLVGAGYNFGD